MLSAGRQTTIGKHRLLELTTECSLAGYYLGITKLPCLINSPLRVDNHPSFSIYTTDGQTVYYRDFATGERGSFLELMSKLWSISYDDVIDRIYKDITKSNSNIQIELLKSHNSISKLSESTTILECKIREWKDYDIEYWESYGVTLDWLKYADVYPISHKIILKDGKRMVFPADKLAYTYVEFKEGKVTHKFYQPFNRDGFKWQNNHDRSVVSLWTKLPAKGEIVCICSSLKDALCVWSNTGIPSVAIQGEGYPLSQTAINELKRRFKRQIISLDGDDAGIKDSKKLAELTNFINLHCPIIDTPEKDSSNITILKKYGFQKKDKAKDWSDIYLYFGKEKFIETFKNLFKWKEQ